jgi:hypothetical protein
VCSRTHSRPTSSATSVSTSRPARTWNVAASVTTTSTGRSAVNGYVASATIFGEPSLAVWVVVTTTVRAPTNRSIAPPTPSTGLPGTDQFAMRPAASTCSAPSTATSTWPPRIIPNDAELAKYDAPGRAVTGCLPACTRSGSTSPSPGVGPTPSSPFSVCNATESIGRWSATIVGIPIPRLTIAPGGMCATARAAMRSWMFMPPPRFRTRQGRRRKGAGSRSPRDPAPRPARSRRPRRSPGPRPWPCRD